MVPRKLAAYMATYGNLFLLSLYVYVIFNAVNKKWNEK